MKRENKGLVSRASTLDFVKQFLNNEIMKIPNKALGNILCKPSIGSTYKHMPVYCHLYMR